MSAISMELKPCPKCGADHPFRTISTKGYNIVCWNCLYAFREPVESMERVELAWNVWNDYLRRGLLNDN